MSIDNSGSPPATSENPSTQGNGNPESNQMADSSESNIPKKTQIKPEPTKASTPKQDNGNAAENALLSILSAEEISSLKLDSVTNSDVRVGILTQYLRSRGSTNRPELKKTHQPDIQTAEAKKAHKKPATGYSYNGGRSIFLSPPKKGVN